jgi:hypothetical protein
MKRKFSFLFVFSSLIRTFEHRSKVLSFENKKENSLFFLYFPHLFVPLPRHKYKRKMKESEQTLQQIERAIRKVADKFPPKEEADILTDIHLRVSQDTGELLALDDDDNEITRCVIEQWIENKDDNFYEEIETTLRSVLNKQKAQIEQMSILKPYSFVLEDDDHEHIAELYLVDDDTAIVDQELMAGLDQDLDNFLEDLLKD